MQTVETMLSEIRERAMRIARPNEAVEFEGLLISRSDTSEPDYQLSDPLFVLMVQGAKRLYLGNRVLEYKAGECLIVTTGLPLSGNFVDATPEWPALAVSMPLQPTAIAALVPSLRTPRGIEAAPNDTLGTLTASPELVDAVARVLRLQDEPDDAAVLAPLFERELMWRLLTGRLGAGIAEIALPDGDRAQISKTIGWLRDNLAEAVAVPELARAAGMSPSTFHRRFRTMTGMTPLQFQKHLRLQEARSLLVADVHTVTGIAHSVGYTSPSQFSREYCRLFGLPPAQDAARLRSRASGERQSAPGRRQ